MNLLKAIPGECSNVGFHGVSNKNVYVFNRVYVDKCGDGAIPIRDVFDEGYGRAFSICAHYAALSLWSPHWHWVRGL